ncbi:MAG: ATP-binding protein [Bacilli bacterium]|jgi:predicted AAA+ superfamily ATPase|nr:ATP-binding protein [Bacilli bacterium]
MEKREVLDYNISMTIERPYFLKQIIAMKDTSPIKVITGIRRCGKSTLLNQLYGSWLNEHGVKMDHIIAIDLEDKQNVPLRDSNLLFKAIKERTLDNERHYLFIDEAQHIDEEKDGTPNPRKMADALNGLNDDKRYDVYVTGSNSRFLSKNVATELADRGYEIKIYPLRFQEFYSAYGGDKEEALNRYLVFGGMPFLFQLPDDLTKTNYLRKLHETVYLCDIHDRYKIRKTRTLDKLIDALYSNIGAYSSSTKLENVLNSSGVKITDDTIQNYFTYLTDAFLFEKADRYDVKGRNYLRGLEKYYAEDLGLRNAKLGFRQIEETHLMENLIYLELRIRGYNVDVGSVREGLKTNNEHEVDFVCHKGAVTIYIQSAYMIDNPSKEKKEKYPFSQIKDGARKIFIQRNKPLTHFTPEGYLVLGLCEFLLDDESLSKEYII